jgi:hypothetical protein
VSLILGADVNSPFDQAFAQVFDTCGYDLHVEVGYSGPDNNCDPYGNCAGPDTGFVALSNPGPSTFVGTLSLDGTAPGGTDVHTTTGTITLNPGDSTYLNAGSESSNQGGFIPVCGGQDLGLIVTITGFAGGIPISFQKFDKDIHSGTARDVHAPPSGETGAPLLSDSYILQGGDPTGGDTGDDFELSQTHAFFDITGACGDPCTLTCGGDITLCNDPGKCSAVVNYVGPSLSGDCTGQTITCSPASGTAFNVGTTTVTCTASPGGGSCTFNVIVHDTEPPTITCPSAVTQGTDPGKCSAVVKNIDPTASDNCSVTVTYATTGATTLSGTGSASGQTFNKGVTAVTYTATDPSGNTANCSFNVTINDTEPPKVTCSVATSELWPPNHTLSPSNALTGVGFKASAVDNCDGTIPVASIKVQVFSDEAELDPNSGSGTFSPDAKNLLADGTLRLRAERDGTQNGRVYLIVAKATDSSGNTGFCTSTVTVTHDQTAKSIASVKAQAAAASAYAAAHNGSPPPGFFVIGLGPIVGPKQ